MTDTTNTMEHVDIPGLPDGVQGLLLDGTEYVAVDVQVTRNPIHHELVCKVTVWSVDKDTGIPLLDSNGDMIETRHTRSCDFTALADLGGVQGLALETVRLAVGDDSEEALGETNDHIRIALAAADAVTFIQSAKQKFIIPQG